VLYSFYRYLIVCLEVKTGDYFAWMDSLPPQHPIFPLNGKIGELFHVNTIEHGRNFMHAMRRVRISLDVALPLQTSQPMLCRSSRC
jgi:hypothetical protein